MQVSYEMNQTSLHLMKEEILFSAQTYLWLGHQVW